jgi:hypothetical protein
MTNAAGTLHAKRKDQNLNQNAVVSAEAMTPYTNSKLLANTVSVIKEIKNASFLLGCSLALVRYKIFEVQNHQAPHVIAKH